MSIISRLFIFFLLYSMKNEVFSNSHSHKHKNHHHFHHAVVDDATHKLALEAKPKTINTLSGLTVDSRDKQPENKCSDHTECDKGFRCDDEIGYCVEIPKCQAWEGRENGDKHGQCLPCRSDTDCGWYKYITQQNENETSETFLDHCWPDGACRNVPPFFIMTFIKTQTSDNVSNATSSIEANNLPVVKPASKFTRGQTICASVIPTAGDKRKYLEVSIKRLEICALKQTAELSKYHRSLQKKRIREEMKKMTEGGTATQKQQSILEAEQKYLSNPYEGIVPYDSLFHDTTGCRSDKNAIRVYTVYDKTKSTKKKGVYDYQQFNAFEEKGLPGTSTVCFQALPISPSNVPVYMEFTVTIENAQQYSYMENEMNEQEIREIKSQFEAFGLKITENDYDDNGDKRISGDGGSVDINQNIAKWQGVVPTSHDVEMFIRCPGGKEFDGVAGICERPSVAKELFFWVLIGFVVITIIGTVIFVFEYNKYQMHLE